MLGKSLSLELLFINELLTLLAFANPGALEINLVAFPSPFNPNPASFRPPPKPGIANKVFVIPSPIFPWAKLFIASPAARAVPTPGIKYAPIEPTYATVGSTPADSSAPANNPSSPILSQISGSFFY